MTFLLRKAETADEKREREKREAKEEKETQTADDASREVYRRYQQLFKELNFAERALIPLTQLSEDIKIIVDEEKPTGFDFENILAYNKIISKQESSNAYNILALSKSNFNLLNYEFTEKNEDGDVVLPPQVPPAPKKTKQERGELEERAYDSEKDDEETSRPNLTTDENFSIFSEGDSAPKNIRRYKTQEKEQKIKLNPEINITELFENYKELANKTYDDFEDRNGQTLTFEKAFLYLHYNRHKTLPENAKNSKIRGADIKRAKELARKKKRESNKKKEEEFGAGFGEAFRFGETSEGTKRTKNIEANQKRLNQAYKKLNEKRKAIDANLESLATTIEFQDKLILELENKKGNIKALAKEALERKLPEIKNIFQYEGRYENPLAEIFPSQPKTLSPEYIAPQELREERAKLEAQKDIRRRVQSGEIDIENPTSEGEKLIARTNKKILDLLEEEKAQQKEVRETIRDAERFSIDIKESLQLIEKADASKHFPFDLKEIANQLDREEDKEKQDKNKIDSLEKQLKNRKEYNSALKELTTNLLGLANIVYSSTNILEKLKPQLRNLSKTKEEYSEAINELMNLVVLKSFTDLGKRAKKKKQEKTPFTISPEEKEKTKKDRSLEGILEKDKKFAPLLSDKEALQLIKDTDAYINRAFKIEEKTAFVEPQLEKLDALLDKEQDFGRN